MAYPNFAPAPNRILILSGAGPWTLPAPGGTPETARYVTGLVNLNSAAQTGVLTFTDPSNQTTLPVVAALGASAVVVYPLSGYPMPNGATITTSASIAGNGVAVLYY